MTIRIRILVTLIGSMIFGFSWSAADADLNTILKPSGGMITSFGSTAPPTFNSVSKMVQARQIEDADEELHEEEGELLYKEKWTYKVPHLSAKHSFHEDQSGLEVESAQSPLQGPILKNGFFGIPNQGRAQPDCNIAVGSTRIMLAVNTSVAIYTKTGERRFATSFENWFTSLSMSHDSVLFDPKVLYDHDAGHFIFLCNARRGRDRSSWFLFSVSKTSDPEGEWAFYAIDMQITGGKREIFWADFPRMGLDQNAIYLTGNMTEYVSFGFRYAKIRVLRKSQVYQFGRITWKEFARLTDSHGVKAINIEPVTAFGASSQGYLVSTTPFDGFKITLWSISNPATANPSLFKRGVIVSSYQFPPSAVQRGGSARLNTRDAGVYNAVFHNGSIYTAHNAAYDWGSGPVSAIRFYQIKTDGTLVQEITYGKNGYYFFYPVVMVDSRDNVVLGFNRSSASTFAGMFFTGRKSSDPIGKFEDVRRLVPGRSYYSIVFRDTEIGRWGDYNGIALDADDSVYFYSEYVKSPALWDSFVGQIQY